EPTGGPPVRTDGNRPHAAGRDRLRAGDGRHATGGVRGRERRVALPPRPVLPPGRLGDDRALGERLSGQERDLSGSNGVAPPRVAVENEPRRGLHGGQPAGLLKLSDGWALL